MREGRSRGGRRWGPRMRARARVTAARPERRKPLRLAPCGQAWLQIRPRLLWLWPGPGVGVGEFPSPQWPLVVSTNQSNPHCKKIELLPWIGTIADFLSHIKTVEKS